MPEALVILTPGFAASESDTACLPMHQRFVECLTEQYPHINITIVAMQYPFRKEVYAWKKTTVHALNGRNRKGVQHWLVCQQTLRTLKAIGERQKIMGVLSFWYGPAAALAEKFFSKRSIPHYCWLQGQDAAAENKYPARVMIPERRVVALSDFLRKTFEKNHGALPAFTIPPGIPTFPSPTGASRTIDILAVGSLIPLKRWELLVDLAGYLAPRIPQLRLKLVGEGPLKSELQKQVINNRLSAYVELTGALPHEQVLQLMQESRLLVHPSSYEGFSGVCQEALASGMHVISFCQPMLTSINHWHVAASFGEMKTKTEQLLTTPLDHTPVSDYQMQNTVKEMMALYGY